MADERGRPTKLTKATEKIIVAAVREGTPFKYAAAAAGVGERTFREWMASGRKGEDESHSAFYAAIKKAFAAGIAKRVKRIAKAGGKQWQADAWYLERMCGEFRLDKGEVKRLEKMVDEQSKQIEELKALFNDGDETRPPESGPKREDTSRPEEQGKPETPDEPIPPLPQ